MEDTIKSGNEANLECQFIGERVSVFTSRKNHCHASDPMDEAVKKRFQKLFTGSMQMEIFGIVHHSYLNAEHLLCVIEKNLAKRFYVDEDVEFSFKENTCIRAVVLKCESLESSQNSDKENELQYDLQTQKLIDGNYVPGKVIRRVPHGFIRRAHTISSEDIVDLIKAYATKENSKRPWTMNEQKRKQLGIHHKVHSVFAFSPSAARGGNTKSKLEVTQSGEGSGKKLQLKRKSFQRLPSSGKLTNPSDDIKLMEKKRQYEAAKAVKNVALKRRVSFSNSDESKQIAKIRKCFARHTSFTDSNNDFVEEVKDKSGDEGASRDRLSLTVDRLKKTFLSGDTSLFQMAVSIACRQLTDSQIDAIDDPIIKEQLNKKRNMAKRSEITQKMTQEEREVYEANKRQIIRQDILKRRMLAKMKTEDTLVPFLKCLPEPCQLASNYGQLLEMTEFCYTFRQFLFPGQDCASAALSAADLIVAMNEGVNGYNRLTGRILEALTGALIRDRCTKVVPTCFGVKLSQLPLNRVVCGEMAHLILMDNQKDAHSDLDANIKKQSVEGVDCDEILEAKSEGSSVESHVSYMKSMEFYAFPPDEQINVFKALINKLLSSESFANFVSALPERLREARLEKESIREEMTNSMAKVSELKVKLDHLKEEAMYEETAEKANTSTVSVETERPTEQVNNSETTPDIKRKLKQYRAEAVKEDEKKKRLQKMRNGQKVFDEAQIVLDSLKQKLSVAAKRYSELEEARNEMSRTQCLGFDRHYRRYWLFSNPANQGLFIEKGWCGVETGYMGRQSSDEYQEGVVTDLTNYFEKISDNETFPAVEPNAWFKVKSESEFNDFLMALTAKGNRENILKRRLEMTAPRIRASFQNTNEQKENSGQENDVEKENGIEKDSDFAAEFKEELKQTELCIRESGFGEVRDLDIWLAKLQTAQNLSTLADLLIECQESIQQRVFCGKMRFGDKSLGSVLEDRQSCTSAERRDDSYMPQLVRCWQNSVKECKTIAGLDLLLHILDFYIDWDRSTKNQKCRKCQKKKDAAQMLLCDDCNVGYHLYCLRPKLKRMPRGSWFCPQCRTAQVTAHKSLSDDLYDSGQTDDSPHPVTLKHLAVVRVNRMNTTTVEELMKEPSSKRKRLVDKMDKDCRREEKLDFHKRLESLFDEISSKRLCQSVLLNIDEQQMPFVVRTRRGADKNGPANGIKDLNAVKDKLSTYKNYRDFFADVCAVVDKAKVIFIANERKLVQLAECEQQVKDLAASVLRK